MTDTTTVYGPTTGGVEPALIDGSVLAPRLLGYCAGCGTWDEHGPTCASCGYDFAGGETLSPAD